MFSNPYLFAKSLYSWLMNCRPLLLITVAGIPCLAKMPLVHCITCFAAIPDNSATSGKFEKFYIIYVIDNVTDLFTCQTCSACLNSLVRLFRQVCSHFTPQFRWSTVKHEWLSRMLVPVSVSHVSQRCTSDSISLFILGQYSKSLVHLLHFPMPKCTSCIRFVISGCNTTSSSLSSFVTAVICLNFSSDTGICF